MAFVVRPITQADLPALKGIIDAVELFPSEMLDEMTAGFLAGTGAREFWLTLDSDGPAAVAYCAPEKMTEGTWNLLLIAVHPEHQKKGFGAALLKQVEGTLVAQGERLLLVGNLRGPGHAPPRATA